MKTKKTYWVDFGSVEISIDDKQFCKICNCLEDNKIEFEVKNAIGYKEKEECKIVRVSLCIEECWATLLVTKLAM